MEAKFVQLLDAMTQFLSDTYYQLKESGNTDAAEDLDEQLSSLVELGESIQDILAEAA